MGYDNYTPRLSIELTQEQADALNRTIPWGTKKYLFQLLCEALIDAIETSSDKALAAILRREVTIKFIPKEPPNVI